MTVTATEEVANEKSSTASDYNSSASYTDNFSSSNKKTGANTLPAGVNLIKVKLGGTFDPAAFTKLLRAIEEGGRFTIVERATVLGTQMELNLRYYWRINHRNTATLPEHSNASRMTVAH